MTERTMVEMSEEPIEHMHIKCRPYARQNNGENVLGTQRTNAD